MKIVELEITNVRGITHILLRPNGRNFIILGPNGSGKSAVVDAIDFLLTGRISRLMGQGTGGITLQNHGPHIGKEPADARVRALVQVPGLDQPIEIERCLANPGKLHYVASAKEHLEPILEIASRGQHVLTRREILDYITADASTRAHEIQQLINVSDIEDIRRALVRVKTDANREVAAARTEVDQAKGAVRATTQQAWYAPEQVLAVVNECRGILGAQPLQELNWRTLKDNVTLVTTQPANGMPTLETTRADVENLLNCFSHDFQSTVLADDSALREMLTEVRADEEFLKAIKQFELTHLGMKLIDDSGRCPLCDVPWEPGRLHKHLSHKLARADKAKSFQNLIAAVASKLTQTIAVVTSSLKQFMPIYRRMGTSEIYGELQNWFSVLETLTETLRSPIEHYSAVENCAMGSLYAPLRIKDALERFTELIQVNIPRATPQQSSWDTLTRLEENLKGIENSQVRLDKATLWNTRANALLDAFQNARDNVLMDLYSSVRDRFVSLYRKLHGEDENQFTARLEPDGAGLSLEVDFYSRGLHPPHALHSEGHQDSMGLCLYLALSERLSSGVVDLVILDDVVMSVDSDHRRQLCSVLATEFPDRQFFITTHDRTWAQQLRSEGIAASSNVVQFFNWSVDTGPQISDEVDLWERIDADLQRDDVPSGAAKLRRGAEEFFSAVCDALGAKVPFKLSGRYELGDLMQGAMGRYSDILRKAKQSAQAWGNLEWLDKLRELESIKVSLYQRINVEQWAVNPNVHYNEWANFSPNDFSPVTEAFHDLFDLFQCSSCNSIFRVLSEGPTEAALKCPCGKVSWNLKGRN